VEPPTRTRARLGSQVTTVAAANAAVAGLGFLGSVLVLPRALDQHAFAAASLFLAAFQCLQEVLGRSLYWATMRLCPIAEAEQPGGGVRMLASAWRLQLRFVAIGGAGILLAAALLHPVLDEPGEASRALMIALAGLAAACAVVQQFGLGALQLRERFAAFGAWMIANSAARLCAWLLLWAAGLLDLRTAVAAHLLVTAAIAVALRRRTAPAPVALPPAAQAADRARLLGFGGRMVLATSLAATAAQVDLFLLDARADDAATGHMRIATQFGVALELVTSAVMTALLPQAGRARTAAERRAVFRRAAACGLAIAALAVASLPVVRGVLPWLLPQYAAAADLYPIVLLGVVCTALTDPLGLLFVSRDRPGRFVLLNGALLAVIVLGNLFAPGEDRAVVTAWVRTAGRFVLGAGILLFLLRDLRARPESPVPPC
jgi:O-antigen/teichoic acid export membrane protein